MQQGKTMRLGPPSTVSEKVVRKGLQPTYQEIRWQMSSMHRERRKSKTYMPPRLRDVSSGRQTKHNLHKLPRNHPSRGSLLEMFEDDSRGTTQTLNHLKH